MKLHLLAGAALVAALGASAAQAAQPNGWYVGGDVGVHELTAGGMHTRSANNARDGSPYGYKFSIDDPTFVGFLKGGYQFDPHWRAEIEGGFRYGDIESIAGSSNRAVPYKLCGGSQRRSQANPICRQPKGSFDDVSGMVNLIYDILPDMRIDPFVGVGVGVSELMAKGGGQFNQIPTPYTTANPSLQGLRFDKDSSAFAYQGIAGVSYHATQRLSVDLTYRYFGTADHRIPSVGTAAIQPGTFRGHYDDQSVTVGLRWNFGPIAAPPPPPPPPPPVEPPPPPPLPTPPPPPPIPDAREFIVYFPFDQSILTTDAQAVVQAAADYSKSGSATKIVVVGHTDTSGSTAYNVRLSERRARTVADALVGLGVQQSVLAVDWKGEKDPAVATGDGVKEPLNRRATININF